MWEHRSYPLQRFRETYEGIVLKELIRSFYARSPVCFGSVGYRRLALADMSHVVD